MVDGFACTNLIKPFSYAFNQYLIMITIPWLSTIPPFWGSSADLLASQWCVWSIVPTPRCKRVFSRGGSMAPLPLAFFSVECSIFQTESSITAMGGFLAKRTLQEQCEYQLSRWAQIMVLSDILTSTNSLLSVTATLYIPKQGKILLIAPSKKRVFQ